MNRSESRGDASAVDRRSIVVASLVMVGLVLALLVMLGRVAQLQVRPGEALLAHMPNRTTTRAEPAVRGDLLDRRGRLLSASRFGYRIIVDPVLLPDPPHELIVRLAAACGLPEGDVGQEIMGVLEQNRARAEKIAAAEAAGSRPPSAAAKLAAALVEAKRRFHGEDGPGAEPIADSGEVIEAEGGAEPPPRLIRYRVVGGVLGDAQTRAVREMLAERNERKRARFPGVYLERRVVREGAGDEAASIVGKVGFDGLWLTGAERLLDRSLQGQDGFVRYQRDAAGNPLWIEPGQVRPPVAGADVRLSIDLEIQRIAFEELSRGVYDCDAAGGRLVAMDPATGEIVAMVDLIRDDLSGLSPYPWEPIPRAPPGAKKPAPGPRITVDPTLRYQTIKDDPNRRIHPSLARNRCVEDVYEPGSTFKCFVWPSITDLGLARPDEVFDTEGGRWATAYGRPIQDVTRRDSMTWREVLINSSNIGMIKGGQRMTFRQLHDAVGRFGFGRPTGLGLPGEAAGVVTNLRNWTKYTHTSVSFGYEVAVTPLQMVRAFSALARDGREAGTLVPLRMTSPHPDDRAPGVVYRVLPPEVARLTRQTLAGVTAAMETKLAQSDASQSGWQYSIFGKSGTAKIPLTDPPKDHRRPRGSSAYFDNQYNSSFIAGGPTESPRLVCVVVIDDPGPDLIRRKVHYGSSTAGPVARRFLERALAYVGAPISSRAAGADDGSG
ncbi:MAG: penicillin-binding protein 2 [Phycisphaerae bacterium]|nr:penicillin-binding protein 2 [Phycisphaerae bacterium]